MNADKKNARIAGVLYLFLILSGAYGVVYIPSHIIGTGDAAATARNILSNEFIFRTGIINDIVSNTIFVFLVLALYRLFKPVNAHQARLMVALVIVQIPAVYMMETINIATLMIFKGELLKTLELAQRHDVAMAFLKLNEYGTLVLEMFWGLWLLPFGLLVYRSGFIPRILGIFLIMGGIGYMSDSIVALLFPDYHAYVNQSIIFFVVAIGELSIMLWLLMKGVRDTTPAPVTQ